MVGVEHLLQTLQVDQRTAVVVRLVGPGAERQLFLLVIGTSLPHATTRQRVDLRRRAEPSRLLQSVPSADHALPK